MSGKAIPAGTMIPVPMRVNGEPRPMSELMSHYGMPIEPAFMGYGQMLLTFAELILGIPRQLSGQGTQHDVETLGGQQLQLDRSATVLKPYWENVQDEEAAAEQNAFECLQKLMKAGAMRVPMAGVGSMRSEARSTTSDTESTSMPSTRVAGSPPGLPRSWPRSMPRST